MSSFFVVVLGLLLWCTFTDLLQIAGLEEVEEAFLVDSLGDGLAWLALLRLLLLLDLLLGDILAVLPLDLGALGLLDHVLALH